LTCRWSTSRAGRRSASARCTRTSPPARRSSTRSSDPDPWHGFVGYLEATFALQANDRGLSDALIRQYPRAVEVSRACHRGAAHIERIIQRAKESGQLRADFEMSDMTALVLGMSRVIRETPDSWRKFLTFFLDGLRVAEEAPALGEHAGLEAGPGTE
jgi:hypothetical protein